jgi:hypothetical protein
VVLVCVYVCACVFACVCLSVCLSVLALASHALLGRYRLDNLILDPTENKVLAVLDWELSTLGLFLFAISFLSVACLCAILNIQ